jgi:hypothetical protein
MAPQLGSQKEACSLKARQQVWIQEMESNIFIFIILCFVKGFILCFIIRNIPDNAGGTAELSFCGSSDFPG